MKNNNFYVIGGRYRYVNHGGTKTLLGAKRLATKNEEYWDNWKGWRKPDIFKASDCYFDKDGRCFPVAGAIPYMVWNRYTKEWETF